MLGVFLFLAASTPVVTIKGQKRTHPALTTLCSQISRAVLDGSVADACPSAARLCIGTQRNPARLASAAEHSAQAGALQHAGCNEWCA